MSSMVIVSKEREFPYSFNSIAFFIYSILAMLFKMSTRTAFDNYAQTYDEGFTFSEVGLKQRAAVWRSLFPFLKPHMRVLEINCGTGHDAIEISKRVKSIKATDISPEMI